VTDPRPIPRQLLDLALPIIGLNVLTVLALAVDTAMVGRLTGSESALAGLGFASQIVFLLMVAQMGLTVGCVATVARAYGAGDHARVEHVLQQATMLTLLLGGIVAVLGNVVAPGILRGLGADGPTLDQGLRYLRPLLTGTVFYYLNLLFAGVLRGVGNTKLPFRVAVLTNVVNFVLNYGLILGNYGMPKLGVQGAAIGTLVSYATGTVVMIALLNRGSQPGLSVPLRLVRVDGPLARQLFRVGWPAALDMLILNAGFLSILGMLGRIAPAAVAAHGVGLRIQALAFVPGMSISQATAAMVGQALGAGNAERANAVVRASIGLCTAMMTALCLLLIAGAHPLTALFDLERGSQIGDLAVLWMKVLGLGMPIVGVWIAFVGMLQGSGFTNTSLRINFGATLIQIPLSYVLGFPLGLGPFGVWIAFPISFALKAVLGWFAWRGQSWAVTGARGR
jgi:putative MATE family efflux protein